MSAKGFHCRAGKGRSGGQRGRAGAELRHVANLLSIEAALLRLRWRWRDCRAACSTDPILDTRNRNRPYAVIDGMPLLGDQRGDQGQSA